MGLGMLEFGYPFRTQPKPEAINTLPPSPPVTPKRKVPTPTTNLEGFITPAKLAHSRIVLITDAAWDGETLDDRGLPKGSTIVLIGEGHEPKQTLTPSPPRRRVNDMRDVVRLRMKTFHPDYVEKSEFEFFTPPATPEPKRRLDAAIEFTEKAAPKTKRARDHQQDDLFTEKPILTLTPFSPVLPHAPSPPPSPILTASYETDDEESGGPHRVRKSIFNAPLTPPATPHSQRRRPILDDLPPPLYDVPLTPTSPLPRHSRIDPIHEEPEPEEDSYLSRQTSIPSPPPSLYKLPRPPSRDSLFSDTSRPHTPLSRRWSSLSRYSHTTALTTPPASRSGTPFKFDEDDLLARLRFQRPISPPEDADLNLEPLLPWSVPLIKEHWRMGQPLYLAAPTAMRAEAVVLSQEEVEEIGLLDVRDGGWPDFEKFDRSVWRRVKDRAKRVARKVKSSKEKTPKLDKGKARAVEV